MSTVYFMVCTKPEARCQWCHCQHKAVYEIARDKEDLERRHFTYRCVKHMWKGIETA